MNNLIDLLFHVHFLSSIIKMGFKCGCNFHFFIRLYCSACVETFSGFQMEGNIVRIKLKFYIDVTLNRAHKSKQKINLSHKTSSSKFIILY